jgi:SAM-dependent methyltransferase
MLHNQLIQPAALGRARLPGRTRQQQSSARAAPETPGQLPQGGTIAREVLLPADRAKLNRDDDRRWYTQPRFVQHSDDAFRRQLTQLYAERIPEGGAVLDLCSSWVSHLPPGKRCSQVVGHGLSAEELARNPVLDSWFVRDLNTEPDGWALADQSFDAVLCCCSVQYMQQPERVFAEIYRVLKPGGVVIISFTNRLFYEKAVAAWRDGTGYSRTQLVKQYILAVRGFTEPEAVTAVGVPPPSGPLEAAARAVTSFLQRASGDPFYGVLTYRNWKRVDE